MTAVEEPVDCPNVSRIACTYAGIFQECLQTSGLPTWNRLNNTGFWRQLTVSFIVFGIGKLFYCFFFFFCFNSWRIIPSL